MLPAPHSTVSDRIAAFLVAQPQAREALYALVDASHDPFIIPPTIEALTPDAECLFRGKAKEDLGDQTAWIARIDGRGPLLDWLIDEVHGRSMVSFVTSELTVSRLAVHLRKFTKSRDAKGTEHFFRFYNPKVMRQYLPVFDAVQLATFFRSISSCIVEDTRQSNRLLVMRRADGALSRREIDFGDVPTGITA